MTLFEWFLTNVIFFWKKRAYVVINFKSGGQLRGWYREFSYEEQDDLVTRLTYTMINHQILFIKLSDIDFINATKTKGWL